MSVPRALDPLLRQLVGDGSLELVVRGDCMAPAMPDGSRVEVVPARLCWPGDVIVFRGDDGLLRAHRLLGYRWGRGGLACVTRGDADPGRDAPVSRSRVIGRVRRSAAGGRLSPPAARLRAVAMFLGLAVRRLGLAVRRFGLAVRRLVPTGWRLISSGWRR